MTYCTQADLAAQYGDDALIKLTDRINKPATTVDGVVLNRAIADAAAEIDLYLHGRYPLPLDEAPAVLKRLCGVLAFARLHESSAKDHPAHQRADEARDTLRRIAKGELSIGLSETQKPIKTHDGARFSLGRNDWGSAW